MTRPLQFFLSLSVCAHLAAAALWHESLPLPLGNPQATMQISLLAQTESQPEEQVSTSPVPAQTTLTESKKGTTRPAKAAPKQSTRAQTNNNLNATDKPSLKEPVKFSAKNSAGDKDRYLSRNKKISTALKQLLSANFIYPRLARQRGWEGTVVISLRILPDGNLTNIQVADSSGSIVLDRAAIRSMQQITIPQAIAWMQGKELDMIIPIEYHLLDT